MTFRPTTALADANGDYRMLALDQRESLRAMIGRGDPTGIPDADLTSFKTTAVSVLSGHVTAVLLDREFGVPALRAAGCPVILAADVLSASRPGGPVDHATIDEGITPELVADLGVAALKMLVPWRPSERSQATDLAADFMALCHDLDLPGIVEGVVRPPDVADWAVSRRDEALVTAATDLATSEPDMYKAEVPSYGRGTPERMQEVAAAITAAVPCPWVVLSSGVAAGDFPGAVAACRQGGAAGFLAGRAVWADALAADDPRDFISTESVSRLALLKRTVQP